MKRTVIKSITKMCAEAVFLTAVIAVVIGVLGYINKWNSSIAYSNAFFVAGCLVIVAGGMSRLSAGQDRNNFQLFHAESFRDLSSSEQANFIINASSSVHLVILGLLIGTLLILISAIAAYLL
jgi:hypothetical protein